VADCSPEQFQLPAFINALELVPVVRQEIAIDGERSDWEMLEPELKLSSEMLADVGKYGDQKKDDFVAIYQPYTDEYYQSRAEPPALVRIPFDSRVQTKLQFLAGPYFFELTKKKDLSGYILEGSLIKATSRPKSGHPLEKTREVLTLLKQNYELPHILTKETAEVTVSPLTHQNLEGTVQDSAEQQKSQDIRKTEPLEKFKDQFAKSEVVILVGNEGGIGDSIYSFIAAQALTKMYPAKTFFFISKPLQAEIYEKNNASKNCVITTPFALRAHLHEFAEQKKTAQEIPASFLFFNKVRSSLELKFKELLSAFVNIPNVIDPTLPAYQLGDLDIVAKYRGYEERIGAGRLSGTRHIEHHQDFAFQDSPQFLEIITAELCNNFPNSELTSNQIIDQMLQAQLRIPELKQPLEKGQAPDILFIYDAASSESKRIPASTLVTIINQVVEENPDLKISILMGQDDPDTAIEVARHLSPLAQKRVTFWQHHDISLLLSYSRQAKLVIPVDTGLMHHLAFMDNPPEFLPIFGLFGMFKAGKFFPPHLRQGIFVSHSADACDPEVIVSAIQKRFPFQSK
jgi:ADP-heptose:LPS heptosyltransferase